MKLTHTTLLTTQWILITGHRSGFLSQVMEETEKQPSKKSTIVAAWVKGT